MNFSEMFNTENVSNDLRQEAEQEALAYTHQAADANKDAAMCTTVMMVGTIAECLAASAEMIGDDNFREGYSGALLGVSVAVGLYARLMSGDNENAVNQNLESITEAIKEQAKEVDFKKAQQLTSAYGALYKEAGNGNS